MNFQVLTEGFPDSAGECVWGSRKMPFRSVPINKKMKGTILTIGDEILIGQIVDTNSVSIARHLNAAGIVVCEKCSICDDRPQIVQSLERALLQSDIVVITGGLGPTKDDITKTTRRSPLTSSGCSLRAELLSTI